MTETQKPGPVAAYLDTCLKQIGKAEAIGVDQAIVSWHDKRAPAGHDLALAELVRRGHTVQPVRHDGDAFHGVLVFISVVRKAVA